MRMVVLTAMMDVLAGSTLRVIDGLRVLIEDALVPVDAAINSCTKNPAEMLGFADR